jgi:hypothetical protein
MVPVNPRGPLVRDVYLESGVCPGVNGGTVMIRWDLLEAGRNTHQDTRNL